MANGQGLFAEFPLCGVPVITAMLFTSAPFFTMIFQPSLSGNRITAASDNRIDADGDQRISAGV